MNNRLTTNGLEAVGEDEDQKPPPYDQQAQK